MALGQRRTTQCMACQGNAGMIGEVPFSYHFLQHKFPLGLETGDLYECSECGLWFKYPYLSEERISDFYRGAPDNLSWDNDVERQDFACAVAAITKTFAEGGSVLDVGCYRGLFLRALPERFLRQGIEPSSAASQAASRGGIDILGKDLSALGSRQFDAITLFDVFEHLNAPLETLDTLFAHLRPGGLLCIGTGFADFPAFHRAGSKYCYVCVPEHVCFLTKGFLTFLADRYRSQYQLSTISKTRENFRSRLRAAAINCVNAPMLLLKGKKTIFAAYPFRRLRVVTSRGLLPLWPVDDHVVAVFRKDTASN